MRPGLAEGDPVKALIVLAAVTAYQQVENYYVQPRVTQSTLEIHAAVAFGSVIVGATLFGATGALLAIPVVDEIGRLVGRITIDDIVDVIREKEKTEC